MKRVPTLMDAAEFREYLDWQKKAVEEMKSVTPLASWIRSLTWPNK